MFIEAGIPVLQRVQYSSTGIDIVIKSHIRLTAGGAENFPTMESAGQPVKLDRAEFAVLPHVGRTCILGT